MSDLDRVLGRRLSETTTADIAPVMVGGGPGAKRPGLVKKKGDEKDKQRRRSISGVLGVLGESEEEEYEKSQPEEAVIPKNAEEMEDGRTDPSGLNLKEPKFTKKAPDSPKDGTEQLMSPKAALVAPDVTPDSMVEIDPSEVPGPSSEETFRVSDTAAPPPPPPEPDPIAAPGTQQDTFTTAMDALLGRSRSPQPVPTPGGRPVPPPAMESAPVSPEAAAAMFTSQVGDPLKQGVPMPDPKVGDGKAVCEAFRRFC